MSQTTTTRPAVIAPPPFHRVIDFLEKFSDELIVAGGHGADVTALLYDQETATLIINVSTPAAAEGVAAACGFGPGYVDVEAFGRIHRSWLGRYGKATPLRVELRAVVVDLLPASLTPVPEVPAREIGEDL